MGPVKNTVAARKGFPVTTCAIRIVEHDNPSCYRSPTSSAPFTVTYDTVGLGGTSQAASTVEIDKFYIGGKDRQGENDKASVLGMVERKGDVITRQIPDRHRSHIFPQVKRWVVEGSRGMTDDAQVPNGLDIHGYVHETVNHSAEEYVRGDAHTNTIESFWSMLDRGIRETYIHVSKKHLGV